MVTDTKWKARAQGLLKAELKRQGIGYKELAERLERLGSSESAQNIANKLSRSGFSAAFLLQCLHAVGCKNLHLDWED